MGRRSIDTWCAVVFTIVLVLALLGVFGQGHAAVPNPDGLDGYRANGLVCIVDYRPGDAPLYLEGKALPPCATVVPAP